MGPWGVSYTASTSACSSFKIRGDAPLSFVVEVVAIAVEFVDLTARAVVPTSVVVWLWEPDLRRTTRAPSRSRTGAVLLRFRREVQWPRSARKWKSRPHQNRDKSHTTMTAPIHANLGLFGVLMRV